MVQLKRAKVTRTDLGLFHFSCIRSIMNYTLPAFHFSLPKYLTQELEQAVQKRAMSNVSYHEALVIMKFKKIATHHDEICESPFQTIVNDNNHRLYSCLYKLLPAPHESTYSLRRARSFNMPRFKTDLFKNSFIIFSCLKATNL